MSEKTSGYMVFKNDTEAAKYISTARAKLDALIAQWDAEDGVKDYRRGSK